MRCPIARILEADNDWLEGQRRNAIKSGKLLTTLKKTTQRTSAEFSNTERLNSTVAVTRKVRLDCSHAVS